MCFFSCSGSIGRSIVGLVAAIGICSVAGAHEFSIEKQGDGYRLLQGHSDGSHVGEKSVPYDPDVVQAAYCTGADGKIEKLVVKKVYPVRIEKSCVAVLIEIHSGYWTETKKEAFNKPKTQVKGALRSWLSEESIKSINLWTTTLVNPLSPGFELVPQTNPLLLAKGDKLKVLVTWKGKPKAGAMVAYQGELRGISGADGTINIRLRQSGKQVIGASVEEPLNDPKTDKIIRATILQFQIP